MFCLALGSLAIVAFLSVAFLWFDASNLPTNNPSTGETHHPALFKRPDKQPDVEPSAPSQDLIATTRTSFAKAPIKFTSASLGSLDYGNLNATFTLDKTIWRYTTDGWQDISKANNRSQTPKPLLENVHPAIWTTMLILASLLLLLMFCSERDVNRLLSPATHNGGDQEMQPKQ